MTKTHITIRNGRWCVYGGSTLDWTKAIDWTINRCTLCLSKLSVSPGATNYCNNSTGHCGKFRVNMWAP